MSAIVEHQLRRAATSGGASVGAHAVDVLPVAQDLRGALLKVHGSKDFSLELAIPPDLQFVGDRDDLIEALGNLMDNACEVVSRAGARQRRRCSAAARRRRRSCARRGGRWPGHARRRSRTACCERGARADEHTPGHGLGLAMVRDMVELYGGALLAADSRAGRRAGRTSAAGTHEVACERMRSPETMTWNPASWQTRKAQQQPHYADAAALETRRGAAVAAAAAGGVLGDRGAARAPGRPPSAARPSCCRAATAPRASTSANPTASPSS